MEHPLYENDRFIIRDTNANSIIFEGTATQVKEAVHNPAFIGNPRGKFEIINATADTPPVSVREFLARVELDAIRTELDELKQSLKS